MTTDCMPSGLSPRPAAIDGSAVLTIVESSICMKTPSATSQSSGLLIVFVGTACACSAMRRDYAIVAERCLTLAQLYARLTLRAMIAILRPDFRRSRESGNLATLLQTPKALGPRFRGDDELKDREHSMSSR